MSRSPEINAFEIILFGLIFSNHHWQRFTSISYFNSGMRVQCPYQNSIALDVHHLSRMRFSWSSSYMFYWRTSFTRTRLSCSSLTFDQDDPFGRVWGCSSLAPSVAPLSMGHPGKCGFLWTFVSKLVSRVMILLVRNHVDLFDREACHMSPVDLLCRFRC